MEPTAKEREILFTDLGLMHYNQALSRQIETRDEKLKNPHLPDHLFFVEHPPVFTFGKNGGRENLMVSDAFLDQNGVETVQTRRGGNITYHGPGQAVLYPVIDLNRAGIGVADFVTGLEEIMKNTLLYFNLKAGRDARNHGIWINNSKIGSIGLAIKKGISMHGLALNINPDLTPFSWVNPCGLKDVSITSVEKELSGTNLHITDISMAAVKEKLIDNFCNTFNIQVIADQAHV